MSNSYDPAYQGQQPLNLNPSTSPFDQIMQTRPDGSKFWSARDLQTLMGYTKWEKFEKAIERAMTSAQVQNYDLNSHFTRSGKVVQRPQGGGTTQKDYELSRFAAYLTSMNGDPNKPQVAAAQSYFAIQTHVAETAPKPDAAGLSRLELLQLAMTAETERLELEAKNAALEAPARSWNALAAPGGDYSVSATAKVLSRDPAIEIGRDRLFKHMHGLGWIFRTTGRRAHWEADQAKGIKTGRLSHKLGGGFINEKTGEWEQAKPTVRVTPKGLHELHKSLGGSTSVALEGIES